MGVLNNRENELINDGRDKPSEVYTRVANEQDHEQLSPKEMTDADESDQDDDIENDVKTDSYENPDDPKVIEDLEDDKDQDETDDANNSKIVNDSKENVDDPTTNKNEKPSGDIVFEGTAKENPQYGEGGGKQYFIRDFGGMNQDGRMTKIGEEKLEYTGPLLEDDELKAEIEKQKYNYVLDTRPLTDEEKAEWHN